MDKLINVLCSLFFETLSPMVFGMCILMLFTTVIPQNDFVLWLWWVIAAAWHGSFTVLSAVEHVREDLW